MSANNFIQIKQTKENEFKVYHGDADVGYDESCLLKTTDTLESAVNIANETEEEYNEEGFGVEYGIRIDLLDSE